MAQESGQSTSSRLILYLADIIKRPVEASLSVHILSVAAKDEKKVVRRLDQEVSSSVRIRIRIQLANYSSAWS